MRGKLISYYDDKQNVVFAVEFPEGQADSIKFPRRGNQVKVAEKWVSYEEAVVVLSLDADGRLLKVAEKWVSHEKAEAYARKVLRFDWNPFKPTT